MKPVQQNKQSSLKAMSKSSIRHMCTCHKETEVFTQI